MRARRRLGTGEILMVFSNPIKPAKSWTRCNKTYRNASKTTEHTKRTDLPVVTLIILRILLTLLTLLVFAVGMDVELRDTH